MILTAKPGNPAKAIRTYQLPNGELVIEETTLSVSGSAADSNDGFSASVVASSSASATCTARKQVWSTFHITKMIDAKWVQKWTYDPYPYLGIGGKILTKYTPTSTINLVWPFRVASVVNPYNWWVFRPWQAKAYGQYILAYNIGADIFTDSLEMNMTFGPFFLCSWNVTY